MSHENQLQLLQLRCPTRYGLIIKLNYGAVICGCPVFHGHDYEIDVALYVSSHKNNSHLPSRSKKASFVRYSWYLNSLALMYSPIISVITFWSRSWYQPQAIPRSARLGCEPSTGVVIIRLLSDFPLLFIAEIRRKSWVRDIKTSSASCSKIG